FSTILAAADNQQLTLAAGNILTLEDGGTVNLTPFLDNTDNQQITAFSLDNTSNELTLTLEDGGTQTVDFSTILAAADNQQLTLAAGNILTLEDGGTVNLTPFLDNTDNQQITAFSLDNTSNELTLTLEDGGTQTVDFSTILAAADNQQLTLAAGNILTLEDGGTVNLTPFLDNTDNQQITAFSLDGATNILTLTLEDGGTQTVNLNGLVGTDDQTAAEVSYDGTTSGLTATNVQDAIDAINTAAGTVALADNGDGTYTFTDAAGGTTTISDTSISTLVNNGDATFTYTDETGTPVTINLISGDANNNIIAGSDGGLYLNVASVAIAETITNLTDVGDGTVTYVNENGVTQKVNKADLTDNGNGTYTFTNGDGTDVILDTRADSNPYDGTTSGLTATNVQDAIDQLASGSTDDQQLTLAAGNILTLEDGGTVNLTPFLDNTDNQQITAFSLDNTSNELTLTLEDGGTQTVDFSTILAAADNQQLTLAAGNILTLEDGGTVNLTPFLDNTDNQQITAFSLDNTSNELTLTLEDGGTQTVDFSTILAAADNQQLTLAAGNILTLEDGGTVNLTPFLDNTDNQQITAFSLDNTSNELTLTLEDGGTQTVDFSTILAAADNQQLTLAAGNILTLEDGGTVNLTPFLDNTDNQQITAFSLDNTSNELTLTLEDGGTQTVDFSTILAAADNQQLTLAAGNILTLEDGGTVNLTPFLDNTDNQQITAFSLDNTSNELTLTLEDGGTQTVDFSTILAAADNQQLTLAAGNILTLEDGGTVNLTPFLDNTDNQQITAFSLDNTSNELTLTLEDGGTQTVDFSTILAAADNQQLTLAAGNILTLEDGGTVNLTPFLDNTDNQQITAFSLDGATNILTLTLEDGGTQTVNLNGLVGTDDQTAAEVSYDGTTSGLTATNVQDAIDAINTAAGTVALADNGDGTYTFTDAAGGTTTISDTSISTLVNNGDATFTYTDETGTPVTINLISGDANNNIIAGSDGGLYLNVASVAIAETITNLTDVGDGTVTYVNENGVTQKVNKADLTDNGNGTYTFTNGDGTDVILDTRADSNPYDGTTSGLTATNVQDAIDQLASGSTDDQQLTLAAGNILTLEDGGTVNLTPFLDNTDNQQITAFSLDGATNILTLTLEDGGTQTVNLNGLVGTDDQTAAEVSIADTAGNFTAGDVEGALAELALGSTDNQQLTLAAGNILTLEDGGTVNLTPFLDNTDNQQITAFSLDNTSNELTLTLEDGGTQTVDFSTILAAADNQQLTLAAGNILTLEDGGTVNLTPFLDNTDNQQITAFSLDNTSNELTLTLEDGGTQTVDFSTILAAADNQQLTLAAGNILTL
ncbi:beta strand repeat-containing protein, partial [Spongiimicrobium salis]|uniref:beta strand repeat-containing protein n=1 Tax=Spongiimicrobium salis TaxID=1667022 RepID=UPI00374CF229